MITIKLLDSISSVKKKVNKACAEHINKTLIRKGSAFRSSVKKAVESFLMNSPELLSLTTAAPDSLMGHFGLSTSQATVAASQILDSVKDSITIKIVKFNDSLKGGIEVNVQPSNFTNLLSLGSGHLVYDKGDLHWLSWLLTFGDSIIVVGYEYNPETGLGRANLGNMVEGGSWRVPPEFSGTIQNNFITRALVGEKQAKTIADIFRDTLE